MVFEVDADAIRFHDEIGVAQVEFDAECGIAIGDIEAFVVEFCTVGRTETFADRDEVRVTDGDVLFEEVKKNFGLILLRITLQKIVSLIVIFQNLQEIVILN